MLWVVCTKRMYAVGGLYKEDVCRGWSVQRGCMLWVVCTERMYAVGGLYKEVLRNHKLGGTHH